MHQTYSGEKMVENEISAFNHSATGTADMRLIAKNSFACLICVSVNSYGHVGTLAIEMDVLAIIQNMITFRNKRQVCVEGPFDAPTTRVQ